jgi:hypothetical protein
MGNYGEASKIATNLIIDGKASSPLEAWEEAVSQVFPNSESYRGKGCPKNTFMGLCEEGLVLGVSPGNYTKSKKNKKYGLRAIEILKKNPSLAENEKSLWEYVMNGEHKTPNHQMDVVCTLWRSGLIDIKKP